VTPDALTWERAYRAALDSSHITDTILNHPYFRVFGGRGWPLCDGWPLSCGWLIGSLTIRFFFLVASKPANSALRAL
jgi:hypothetical protein